MTYEQRRRVACAHCGALRRNRGRGLCGACTGGWNGCDPLNYPRATWSSLELAGDYHVLRLRGLSQRDAAAYLGVSFAALDKALDRSGYRRRFTGIDINDLRRTA